MSFERYVPGRDGPFGFDEAAHLARRAGFSLPSGEVDRLAGQGLDAALERFAPDGVDEGEEARKLGEQAAIVVAGGSLSALQGLWLARMATTSAPAAEKLALFWHGHFATSFDKVKRADFMWRQYLLFREHGAGSFEELLQQVSRDPAMLVWLDGNSNERGRPNENFAREVMELFSLGVGRYGEKDVQEAARAFSGWHVKDGEFWFNARAHDDGEKVLLGRRGALDGGDVVAACASQPACPRFLAAKLLRFYVEPDPEPVAIGELAALLEDEKLSIGATLRRLFASKLFFSPAARLARIASPVELCVGALRRLRARASWRATAEAAASMGQALFAPPSVKGWDGDRAWINSRTLIERARFAEALAFGGEPIDARVEWRGVVRSTDRDEPARLIEALARALLQRPLPDEPAARLLEFATSKEAGEGETRVRRLAHLLLSAPEAQLA
jgi:uncharacterized protein (DUF1800 family)